MKDLKPNELDDFVKSGDVVVDFWAPWCGPCQMLLPVLDEISKELTSVNFAKANVDEVGEEAVSFGIRGVPTLILFRGGKEINRISGFIPKDVLKSQIQDVFS